jgi:cytochrome c-type biogenesis protein CcmH/NrfF
VVIWAFYGIISERIAMDPVYSSSIIWVLWLCSVVILLLIVLRWKKWIKN